MPIPRRFSQTPVITDHLERLRGEMADQYLERLKRYVLGQQQTLDRLWDALSGAVNERHGAGTLAERPTPGIEGRSYYAQDTAQLYWDDGTAWVAIGGGGGITQAYQTVQDEGTPLAQQSVLDFVGAGVTATNDGPGLRTIVTIPGGGGSGYDTIQDEGTPLAQRSIVDFVGSGVTATDDGPGTRTVVTIPGGITQAYTTVEEEGTPLAQRTNLNFVGPGVTAADTGGKTVVTVPGNPNYQTVQDEGVALTQQPILDFVGDGVTASNDGPGTRTVVSIPGATSGVEIHTVEMDVGALPVNEYTVTVADSGVSPTSNILAQVLAVDPSTRGLGTWDDWVAVGITWDTIPLGLGSWDAIPVGMARDVDELIYDRATVAAQPGTDQVTLTLQALEGYIVDSYLVGYTVTA